MYLWWSSPAAWIETLQRRLLYTDWKQSSWQAIPTTQKLQTRIFDTFLPHDAIVVKYSDIEDLVDHVVDVLVSVISANTEKNTEALLDGANHFLVNWWG